MDKIATLSGGNLMLKAEAQQQNQQINKVRSLSKQEIKSEKELEKASSGFEALLLHQMMQSMWATVDATGLLGEKSNQAEIYQDMFQQSVADSVSEGRGIGIKKFLRKELLKTMKTASKDA